MEALTKTPKNNKKRKIKSIMPLPQTPEEIDAVQECFGRAYTEAAVSLINRKFDDPHDRSVLYKALLDLKDMDIVI